MHWAQLRACAAPSSRRAAAAFAQLAGSGPPPAAACGLVGRRGLIAEVGGALSPAVRPPFKSPSRPWRAPAPRRGRSPVAEAPGGLARPPALEDPLVRPEASAPRRVCPPDLPSKNLFSPGGLDVTAVKARPGTAAWPAPTRGLGDTRGGGVRRASGGAAKARQRPTASATRSAVSV